MMTKGYNSFYRISCIICGLGFQIYPLSEDKEKKLLTEAYVPHLQEATKDGLQLPIP
jgi:hypothetical protein